MDATAAGAANAAASSTERTAGQAAKDAPTPTNGKRELFDAGATSDQSLSGSTALDAIPAPVSEPARKDESGERRTPRVSTGAHAAGSAKGVASATGPTASGQASAGGSVAADAEVEH